MPGQNEIGKTYHTITCTISRSRGQDIDKMWNTHDKPFHNTSTSIEMEFEETDGKCKREEQDVEKLLNRSRSVLPSVACSFFSFLHFNFHFVKFHYSDLMTMRPAERTKTQNHINMWTSSLQASVFFRRYLSSIIQVYIFLIRYSATDDSSYSPPTLWMYDRNKWNCENKNGHCSSLVVLKCFDAEWHRRSQRMSCFVFRIITLMYLIFTVWTLNTRTRSL